MTSLIGRPLTGPEIANPHPPLNPSHIAHEVRLISVRRFIHRDASEAGNPIEIQPPEKGFHWLIEGINAYAIGAVAATFFGFMERAEQYDGLIWASDSMDNAGDRASTSGPVSPIYVPDLTPLVFTTTAAVTWGINLQVTVCRMETVRREKSADEIYGVLVELRDGLIPHED